MQDYRERQLTPTESGIVSLLSCAIFGAPYPEGQEFSLEPLLREAEKQAVFPIVFQTIQAHLSMPAEVKWQRRFQQHLAHNVNIIYQHHQAHELMTRAGIPYTVIKGCASGFFYPEPGLRTMGDVDLYVKRSSMEGVRAFLEQEGFHVSGLTHSHHWTFTRDKEVYEVHWLPSGVPVEDTRNVRARFDDLLDRRRLVEFQDGALYFPAPFHHGLILLLHTANHLSAGGIGLRHLLDWLTFVFSMPEREFRDLLETDLRELGLWQFAKVLTAVGVHFFACPTRAFCADISPELTKSILLDIFAGGNFGVKDGKRLMESKLLRDEKTREIDGKSGLRHVVRFLNRKAHLAMPATRKHPILLPLGWVKVGSSYLRTKKRANTESVKLMSLAKSAKEREKLYKQLRMFEK